jgi:hypothetical protein
MKFDDDHLGLNQSQNSPDGHTDGQLSAWVSGDNFVFHATLGEQQGVGLNQSQIADEFQNHAAAQTARQLIALVTPEAHHEAFIDLFHTDHVALPSKGGFAPYGTGPSGLFRGPSPCRAGNAELCRNYVSWAKWRNQSPTPVSHERFLANP